MVNGVLDQEALILRLRQIRDKVSGSKQSPAGTFVAEVVASVMKLVQSIVNPTKTTKTTTTTTTTTTTAKPKTKLIGTLDTKSLLVPEVDPTKDDFKTETDSFKTETVTSITTSSLGISTLTKEEIPANVEITTKSALAAEIMTTNLHDTFPTAPEITTAPTAAIVEVLKGPIQH